MCGTLRLLSDRRGQGEAKGRSRTGSGALQPNAAAVLLHDTLTDRQPDTASRVLLTIVQTFKKAEDSPRTAVQFQSRYPRRRIHTTRHARQSSAS
jgi:hypothetical protein